MKQKFREMQQQMQERAAGHQGQRPSSSEPQSTTSRPSGDYIDFEEIK